MQDDNSNRRPIPARRLRLVRALARWLATLGVTPNQVSIFGLLAGVASGLSLALVPHFPGAERALLVAPAILVLLRGLANMFDGMIAVEHGRATSSGALFNEIPDRVSDVALLIGAGYSIGSHPTLGYLAASMALFIAFVRVACHSAGAPSDFSGIMAKQQRMFSIAAIAVWLGLTPEAWHLELGRDGDFGLITVGLISIIVGGIHTSATRIRRAARYLAAEGQKAEGGR